MTAEPATRSIRPAMPGDIGAITEIYGHHVLYGTGTFEEAPPAVAAMTRRVAAVQSRGWPWLVAEEDGAIAGFAYAAQFRDRAAYRFSGETSVYVRDGATGRGIGQALLEQLIVAAADSGFRRLFAVIGDSANRASIRLHERCGFALAGQFDAAGHKFGRDLDILFMQRTLEERR